MNNYEIPSSTVDIKFNIPAGVSDDMQVLIADTVRDFTRCINKQVNFDNLIVECGKDAINFEVAAAIYHYCNDWHDGQNSILYTIKDVIGYKPSLDEKIENLGGASFYEMLVAEFENQPDFKL